MIRHGIQFLEWLGSLGSNKARVLPDLVEFDENVKLTLDVTSAPGLPVGSPTSTVTWVDIPATAGNVSNIFFNVDAPGGAVLRWLMMTNDTATNHPNGFTWQNRNPNVNPLTQICTAFNSGTRQFDQLPFDSSNQRRVEPFSLITIEYSTTVAPGANAGVDRVNAVPPIGGVVIPQNVYLPPGDAGYSLASEDQNQVIQMAFGFEPLPLSGTGLPRS